MTEKKLNMKGFTLIEVLVSLTIFAIGLLGLGFHLAQDMRTKIDTQVYPTAMQIANQTIESLNESLKTSDDEFARFLARYQQSVDALETTGNPISEELQIQLADNSPAIDGNGKPLLNTAVANWQPPYTVNFIVRYTGQNNTTLNFPVSYVFVPFKQ
jgi:prepilin-type N-terminal cleavage/methylation domain-containing protein